MVQFTIYFFAIIGAFGMFVHFVDILIFFSEFWEGEKGVFRGEEYNNLPRMQNPPPPPEMRNYQDISKDVDR